MILLYCAVVLSILAFMPYIFFSTLVQLPKAKTEPGIAIVLGAGVASNGKPTEVLAKRLDKAIELYKKGAVKIILVSGDNRRQNYNEPKAMKNYLISNDIPFDAIVEDLGGRRTIDTCWRANNVFKIKYAYLVTQSFHMPRSYFLCEQENIKVTPAIAKDPSVGVSFDNYLREVPASILAIAEIMNYEPPIKATGDEKDLSEY
jgi:SanA protein